MSQNKTVVPGMGEGTYPMNENPGNFYERTQAVPRGTVVPGVNPGVAQGRRPASPVEPQPQASARFHNPGKPVVGFLYSVSRQGIGEYWPLYIGPNTIGQSDKCNICLKEGTVSAEHAVLVVRKMKNPEKTVASISDARSTNGTMVNGVSLAFNAVECFNNDVITVGENYELVLILIDTATLGLKVAENFVAVESAEPEPAPFNYSQMGGPQAPTNPGIPSGNFDFNPYQQGNRGAYGPTDGTVGLDGTAGPMTGGTVGLDL